MRIPRPVYKMRRHKRVVIALLLFILPMVSLYAVKPLLAAAAYSITPSPLRAQEGNSVVLTLSLTGGALNTQYVFTISVVQPDSPTPHSTSVSFTTDGSGAGSVTSTYPIGYSGSPNTNFVGTYSIAVSQTTPVGAVNPVATGSFTVGLTDKAAYQRTETVRVQAAGYGNRENVTVDIARGGISAGGFPRVVMASASGIVNVNWHIPLDTQTGTWTVTATGPTTVKAPADTQTMTINPATLIVTVTTDQAVYARTQTITAFAVVHYPDGMVMNDTSILGSSPFVWFTFTNGSNARIANWNQTAQNWYASFRIPAGINPSNLPQAWVVQGNADDGIGNGGANTGSGQRTITVKLVPATPDLQITTMNITGPVGGVFLNITFFNGTIAATGTTGSSGNAFFTLATAYDYWVVASAPGYNDYLDGFFLQGNLMHRTYILSNVLYTGTILSGSYTTLAHYNPGDSGQLKVWIYNQNTTFPITITKIEVQFPWFATYGSSSFGNVTVGGGIIAPKTYWETTVPFTVPNDGRIYAGSGGRVYISGTASAWKTTWIIDKMGNPVSGRVLNVAYINPQKIGIYAGQGFVTTDSITVSFPTQDSTAAANLFVIEVLSAIFLANTLLLALIWMRLKPHSPMPKV